MHKSNSHTKSDSTSTVTDRHLHNFTKFKNSATKFQFKLPYTLTLKLLEIQCK